MVLTLQDSIFWPFNDGLPAAMRHFCVWCAHACSELHRLVMAPAASEGAMSIEGVHISAI